MSKNHVLAIVAATLLGAFWVYPNVERGRAPQRTPQSTAAPTPHDPPAAVTPPIQRKQTHIKPMKVKKTVARPAPPAKHAIKYAKRIRSLNFDRADRRPTSLPVKKSRPKRDNLASN